MNIVATKYRQIADALDVEIQAKLRMRDCYRTLANFFDPPVIRTPPPMVPPPAPDPDFEGPDPEEGTPQ